MSSLRSFLASLLPSFLASRSAEPAGPPPVDVGEEFQKVQRSLRRLSMASDRSAETLQNVSTRLDDMQQRLLQMARPARAGVQLGEQALLQVLDQLERAASMIGDPTAAREPVATARDALLTAAGWQPVAVPGSPPEGTAIRIAEVVPAAANSQSSFNGQGGPDAGHGGGGGEVRIARVLEQGYRRADGSLLRPAVVIATAASSL